MKRAFFALGFAFVAVCAVRALDNTISDDYWNTTGYVNATTSAVSVATATVFDSRVEGARASAAISQFDTRPIGTVIILH